MILSYFLLPLEPYYKRNAIREKWQLTTQAHTPEQNSERKQIQKHRKTQSLCSELLLGYLLEVGGLTAIVVLGFLHAKFQRIKRLFSKHRTLGCLDGFNKPI